jgi:ribosomal protein S18 acetylase RimI-like enzyme
MTFIITQNIPTKEIKQMLRDRFAKHSIEQIGINSFGEEISFEIQDDGKFAGILIAHQFYGAFRIRVLFIAKEYRGLKLSYKLMDHAISFAKTHKLKFATIETLSFQALGLYQKLGFELEFSRKGYLNDVTFHYLSKKL